MALHDDIRDLRNEMVKKGQEPVPESLQGVSKERVKRVLAKLDKATPDMVDVVFALLDDRLPSFFSKAPKGTRFCDGASIAHIACHVGILQRDGTKLDREGRDYWVKPLRDLGAIEEVYFDSTSRTFRPGHPVAKSPNSAHRLAKDFVAILKTPERGWEAALGDWSAADRVRERSRLQAEAAQATRSQVGTKHADLIQAAIDYYVPHFLPGYEVLYVDNADGDRISAEEKRKLSRAGLELGLEDAMPDVLLWHPKTDWLWIIEAVTSDGEVDDWKVKQVTKLITRAGKAGVGFTTAYATWKRAAARQGSLKNLSTGTYLWIQEDGAKHYRVEGVAKPGTSSETT